MLGAFDGVEWTEEEVEVLPGEHLVMYTDGVTEAAGANGRFGELRLRTGLAGCPTPSAAVMRIEAALEAFAAGNPEDDAAVIALSRTARDAGIESFATVGTQGLAG
jgi:serine phosphatase RsbU (regulator of sigma subunit)